MPIAQHIEFVVAHERNSRARLAHGANEMQGLADLRTPIHVIAKKHDLAPIVRIAERAARLDIPQTQQQGAKFVTVTVDVTDKIDCFRHFPFPVSHST